MTWVALSRPAGLPLNTVIFHKYLLNPLLKQSVVVAIPIQHPMPPAEKTHGNTAFRIKLYDFKTFPGTIRHKRQIMPFGHGMPRRNKDFIFNFFALDLVRRIRLFPLQRRQRHTAAGNHSRTGRMENIPANRADVKIGLQQIGRPVGIDDLLPGQQFRKGNLQDTGQRLKQRNVREALPGIT